MDLELDAEYEEALHDMERVWEQNMNTKVLTASELLGDFVPVVNWRPAGTTSKL